MPVIAPYKGCASHRFTGGYDLYSFVIFVYLCTKMVNNKEDCGKSVVKKGEKCGFSKDS